MELTRNEKLMKYAGLLYAVMFIVTTLVFIFYPHLMFSIINHVSKSLDPTLPLAFDSGKFWVSLSISMMATITALSILIFKDVKKNYRMAIPLVTAKFTSSIFGLGFFLAGLAGVSIWNTLANLLILFTDFPLGVLMLVLYLMVKKEQA